MNNENKYHIDVTPEEDMLFREPVVPKVNVFNRFYKPMNFIIVSGIVGVHLVGAAALFALSPKKPQQSVPVVVATPTPTPSPSPSPSPVLPPVKVATPSPSPSPSPGGRTPPSSITSTYTVKQGDTFYSIVKKYKLNSDKLIKLNNIKDPAKLVAGQTLKFK